jgi:glucose 1-dehydrogenase
MKAISITPGAVSVEIIDLPEPKITSPTQVKVKILQVGICGTDREEANGGRADAPEGCKHLVIGHEMLGQVVEKGDRVTSVEVGDYAVFSVRRGCGKCIPCQNNRSDMCYTGEYTERGIKGLHGFEAEYVIDEEQYLVKVPESIKSIGVLAEPMSVAEKAIDEALNIQEARLPKISKDEWIRGRRALVVGMGAVGILASIALILRGADVIGMDIVDEDSKRPNFLKKIGGKYIDGRKIDASQIEEKFGLVDFIFEAAGVAELGFEIIAPLGVNGIYVMTGIPGEGRPVCFSGAEMMSRIVLKNQIILGSVNAGPLHFELALEDLEKAKGRWGNLMNELITTEVPYEKFNEALEQRSVDDIKTVVTWSKF